MRWCGELLAGAQAEEEVLIMTARAGQEAPDFTAKAYHQGGAKEIRVSDYRGKWVMLCFYPADFTCV
jgi:alkyl hydroperoxide reductase subunit AhpC